MDSPVAGVRVGVTGRPGSGRRTVVRALRAAGVDATGPGAHRDADVDVYVFVETLTADDRAALAARSRPTVAVLNKADLTGFGGDGPMAAAGRRCDGLQRATDVPTRPFSALLAVAGHDTAVLDTAIVDALRALAAGTAPVSDGIRRRLAAELDLFGTACAVSAVRSGAGRETVAGLLRSLSGVDGVVREVGRAAGRGVSRSDHLRRAIHWHRYSRGPVSALDRDRARDLARAALRQWARSGGDPAP